MLVLSVILACVAGYLIGSLNFALIVSFVGYRKDIRKFGSGNAGMTNVLRTFGKLPAVITLIGDFSKGIIAILIGRLLISLIGGAPDFLFGDEIVGIFALLGHVFPLYYGFKGGKGILVSGGIILTINPITFLIIFLTFILFFVCTRIVSLGSIASAVAYPIATFFYAVFVGDMPLNIFISTLSAVLIAALVIYMHRSNIKRLRAGEEPRIGK